MGCGISWSGMLWGMGRMRLFPFVEGCRNCMLGVSQPALGDNCSG